MAILTMERQKQIDAHVESIRLNTGLSYPDDSLLDIAKALGVDVVELDLAENINGAVQYQNDNGEDEPKIILNQNFPPQRKVFTLAHELGHFVLHKGEMRFRLDKIDYSEAESIKETEANYFAASLLVPKDKLIRILRTAGNIGSEMIASYFGVSTPVIENRIKWVTTN